MGDSNVEDLEVQNKELEGIEDSEDEVCSKDDELPDDYSDDYSDSPLGEHSPSDSEI